VAPRSSAEGLAEDSVGDVTRPERILIEVSFLMEHPTWTFTFEPAAGGTAVTAQGEWHMGIPAVGGAFESMMAKGHEPFLDSMLAGLKAAVEQDVAARGGPWM
jgi:Polyketide cyclase / dehydrase and lipid transport